MKNLKRNYVTLNIDKSTREKLDKIKLKILKEKGEIVPIIKIIEDLVDKKANEANE